MRPAVEQFVTYRPSSVLVVGAVFASLAAGCTSPPSRAATGTPGTTATMDAGPTTAFGPIAPPPAQVLDATVVLFDADGTDRRPDLPPPRLIDDVQQLDAFTARFVDGDPAMGGGARQALADGNVLIGGPVSSGCFVARGARLTFTAVDIRLLPVVLPPADSDVECVRAITSIALVAIDPGELPAGLPVRGT